MYCTVHVCVWNKYRLKEICELKVHIYEYIMMHQTQRNFIILLGNKLHEINDIDMISLSL